MKIAIVGAGAMGSLFGALLAESGNLVWLLDIWAEHIEAVKAGGLTIERDDQTRCVAIHATTNPEKIGTAELVVVFVKSIHTESAAYTAGELAGDTGLVLTLQNGMGNAEIIAGAVEPDRIIAGTTAHGATLLGPGHIRHAGSGPTVIGMWPGGQHPGLREIAAIFTAAGISTDTVDDIRPVIWEKLLVNVGINAITALTGIKNGQLLDLSTTRDISRAAVEEAMAVARKLGVRVRADAVEHVFKIAAATGANRSSMGQDVDNRRATEIAAINGAVVREAAKAGLKVPVNETLTALIETLQSHYPK